MAPQLSHIHIHIPQVRVSDLELLNDWDLDGVGRAFGDKVPGYRSTSTFLTTLRSNLHLSTSAHLSPSLPSSAISTPSTPAFASTALQFPTPSPLSISTTVSSFPILSPESIDATAPLPQEELPELSYNVAPAEPAKDRVEALKLIADSVAQQRQEASKAVILHPATLSATAVILAIMAKLTELSLMITTSAGLIIAGLVAVRWYTSSYIAQAEAINRKWLQITITTDGNNASSNGSPPKKNGNKNEDPIVLVSKWGDEIIGALVMRVVKRERKGYVRAWTVKLRYRNKGIGRGLLEEAAKVVWARGGRMMEFESQHANSHRALPPFFNGPLEKHEAHARVMLADVVTETRRERSSR